MNKNDRGQVIYWTSMAFNPLGNTVTKCMPQLAWSVLGGDSHRLRLTLVGYRELLQSCSQRAPIVNVSVLTCVALCSDLEWYRFLQWGQFSIPLPTLYYQIDTDLNVRCEWYCYLQSASLMNRILPPCGGPLLYTFALTLSRCAGIIRFVFRG